MQGQAGQQLGEKSYCAAYLLHSNTTGPGIALMHAMQCSAAEPGAQQLSLHSHSRGKTKTNRRELRWLMMPSYLAGLHCRWIDQFVS